MGLASALKTLVPPQIRHDIGRNILQLSVHNKMLMELLSLGLDGKPLNAILLPGNKCMVWCENRNIICYREGFRTYTEIYKTKIYERVWSPKRDDVVLDLGAYVGMFSHRTSGLVGDNGMIVAIEPDPDNAALARQNVIGLHNIRVIEAAVSKELGVSKLYHSQNTACHTLTEEDGSPFNQVNTVTIDYIVERLQLPKVDFIKMDIEGAELLALEGATKTLADYDVKLAIACYHALPDGRPERNVLKEYLMNKGFNVRLIGECLYAEKNK